MFLQNSKFTERYGDSMAEIISVEHINPFLASAKQILGQVCGIQIELGRISKDNIIIEGEPVFIILGITGKITGQVCMVFDIAGAKDIASRMMMGMPVTEMDDMAKSALSELGNMIMGNAATILSGSNLGVDITPPTLAIGTAKIASPNITSFKVPLLYEGGEIKFFFMLKLADQ